MKDNNNMENEQTTQEKEVISKLFIKKEKVIERLISLVELSEGIINIVEETGDVHLEDASNLNNNEKIFLFMLGNYFANKSGLRGSSSMVMSEIAKKISVPITTVPAPLNKLLSNKIITRSEKGTYSLNFENYKDVKNMLLSIKEKNEKP